MKLTLFLSLLSSLTFAQAAICKAGAPCKVRTLQTQTVGAVPAVTLTAGSKLCLNAACSPYLNASGADWQLLGVAQLYSLGGGAAAEITVPWRVPAGVASAPSLTFTGDSNTGLYSVGADQLGVATAGVRSFNFNATAGTLEGTTSAATLSLTANAAVSTTGIISLNGASGISLLTGALTPTTFGQSAQSVYIDGNTGRLYYRDVAPTAARPSFDLGGAPHPVMQQHLFGLDMGYESSATPTFYPVAPRIGGAAATVTPVDAAAAGTAVLGASPSQVEARTSVTAAAPGSISTMVTSAFIRRVGAAPRWCQKVSIGPDLATVRVWLGIASALPGASDSPANSGQSFRYSTAAADGKWQYCYANGAGTTCADTGVAPSTGIGTFDTLCIDCREGGTTACTWWVNGVAKARVTSGLGAGYPLFPYYSIEALGATVHTLYAGPMSVEIN